MNSRIEIKCQGCGRVYGTTQRRRSVHCPECGKARYVPHFPQLTVSVLTGEGPYLAAPKRSPRAES